jgi:carbamoylphosphate synthase large subunit
MHAKGRECVANYSKICRNTDLNLFAAMLRSINFDGLCCINYKIVDGRPFIFEINPRFGASLVPWFPIFVRRAV